jgi:hypothetical protein
MDWPVAGRIVNFAESQCAAGNKLQVGPKH